MPSIICYKKDETQEYEQRRKGVAYMGGKLIEFLKENSPVLTSRNAVFKTLKDCNKGNYELRVQDDNDATLMTPVTKVQKNNGNGKKDKVDCFYEGTGGSTKKIVVIVRDDDDRPNNKKMTVVIPGDRDKVTEQNPYTESVAEDIKEVFGAGGATDKTAAGQYALATITFRRCL